MYVENMEHSISSTFLRANIAEILNDIVKNDAIYIIFRHDRAVAELSSLLSDRTWQKQWILNRLHALQGEIERLIDPPTSLTNLDNHGRIDLSCIAF